MDSLRRSSTDETSGDDRHDPCDVGQGMETVLPEIKRFRQGALQFVGRHEASEQFLAAAPITLGESEERRRAVAEVARGAAATQDEDVVGVEIANHGAVNQRGEPGGNSFRRADDRRIGAAALRDRIFPECLNRRCVARAESACHGIGQVASCSGLYFRRDGIVAKRKGKLGHRLRQSLQFFCSGGHSRLYLSAHRLLWRPVVVRTRQLKRPKLFDRIQMLIIYVPLRRKRNVGRELSRMIDRDTFVLD